VQVVPPGSLRRGLAVVGLVALGGCALVSGAADLSIDDGPGADDAASGADGTTIGDGSFGPDGSGGDGSPPADGGGDAPIDAIDDLVDLDVPVDVNLDGGPTRIRTVTFENGLTGALGADTLTGAPDTQQAGAIDGKASLKARGSGEYGTITFAAQGEVYVAMLVRVENVGAGAQSLAEVLSVRNGASDVAGIGASDPTGPLRLLAAGFAIGASATIPSTVVKVGLHVKAAGPGAGSTGLIEAYVGSPTSPFGAPFASISPPNVPTVDIVSFGCVNNADGRVIVDDIVVDTASFP
jgi:hypothetical protein